MRIGIDLMGGDTPPSILFEAVLQAAKQLDHSYSLVVFATKSIIDQSILPSINQPQMTNQAKIECLAVTDCIAMTDEPLRAFRSKEKSSMAVGMRLIKKKRLDALVSCGNTGALVGGASLSLPMLPGIQRVALLAFLPNSRGSVAVLDVGGSLSCKSHHLVQYARMGAAYVRAFLGIETPVVGLLNIGIESRKGTTQHCLAHEELKRLSAHLAASQSVPPMHFFGNIEGVDIFDSAVDVIVTDGFTGNVLLKSTEGTASFILDAFKRRLKETPSDSFNQTLQELQKQFDPAEHPGAVILGVDAVAVKAHGAASGKAFLSSILAASDLVKRRIISHFKEHLLNS